MHGRITKCHEANIGNNPILLLILLSRIDFESNVIYTMNTLHLHSKSTCEARVITFSSHFFSLTEQGSNINKVGTNFHTILYFSSNCCSSVKRYSMVLYMNTKDYYMFVCYFH